MVTFRLKNYGRTPALLRGIGAKLARTGEAGVPNEDDLPPIGIPIESVIRPGEATAELQARMHPLNLRMTPDDYQSFVTGQTMWWFLVRIELADLFQKVEKSVFRWRFNYRARAFEAYAGSGAGHPVQTSPRKE